MSDTPKTDALREVVIGQYKEDELTGNGMGNILAALTDIETLERELQDMRKELATQRELANRLEEDNADLFLRRWAKAQERAIDAERERDEAREERNQYKGLLIRLYNDLFVHHKGEAVREFKELFREENYN